MRLSESQLQTIRTLPQQTQLFLSIFQPQVIFTAQINAATIGRNARVITYDHASGTYTNIDNGFTMSIGSTFGGNDIGKIRVRSATSSTITVSENSNIDWADNQWLTIYKYVELWPIFPRIIKDPSNAANTLWYKDYDIAYTNQNTILGTYVNAGPHRAIDLQDQNQIYYTSTGTFNLLSHGLSYSWTFEGGSPSTSTAATPGFVTYNTPGHYVTKLIVSGTSGEVDTTYRYVSVYDQSHPPIQKWTISGPQGSRDEGGYTVNIKVYEIVPIQANAVVVIYKKSWYGNTQINLGGNAENNSNIFFVGYVDKDTISYDYQHSEVTFDAVSITGLMKKSSGFAVSVASKITPAYWYELLDMNSRRALYHYLRWHTTALMFNDFQFIGTDYKIQYFDSNRESMYDALSNYMRDTLIGQVVADRQGKVWMEVEAMAYPNPTGSFGNTVMSITNRDWMNQPTIEERLHPDIAYAEYGGIAYSGVVTGTFNAYIGSAPGTTPGFFGGIDNHEGLALAGQTQLNQLVGNVVANKNSPYPTINEDLSFTLANLDIAPQETVGQHIAKGDTVRNIAIDGLYIPNSMTWKYEPKNFVMLPNVDFKQLVNGIPGETVTIPKPKDIGPGYQNLDVPPIALPPLTIVGGTTAGTGPITRCLTTDATFLGLLYTENFDADSPTWSIINGGLPAAKYLLIEKIFVTPNGALWVSGGMYIDRANLFIARADYPGAPFVELFNADVANDIFGIYPNPASTRIYSIGYNPNYPEEVIFGGANANGRSMFRYNPATGDIDMLPSLSSVNYDMDNATFGGNKWLTNNLLFNSDYTGVSSVPEGNIWYSRAGQLPIIITDRDNIILRVSTNNYVTFTDYVQTYMDLAPGSGDTTLRENRIAISDDGTQIIARGNPVGSSFSRSNGVDFTPITNLPPDDHHAVYAYAGGAGDASAWVVASNDGTLVDLFEIYYNDDGVTGNWSIKTGNIKDLNLLWGPRCIYPIREQ